jgi:uncharacterized protein (DUF849 family)
VNQPAVIAVAPNGARRTKADHPALPLTPGEIARDAAACAKAGATMLHLHVRDEAGGHSLDPGRYRETIAAVRAEVGPGLLIQITTESVGRYSPKEQIAVVRELHPEAASVALREMMPDASFEARAGAFYREAAEQGIAVQHILYEPREAAILVDLARRGVIPHEGLHPLFVLGRYAPGQQSEPAALLAFLDAWPEQELWSVCAFGQAETASLALALALGGQVRVGFENSIVRPDGSLAADNAEAVARVAGIARLIGRPLASPDQARKILRVR